jgi:hypothetical protein
MLTQKLHIINTDNDVLLEKYQYEYTKLFYKLYNNPDIMVDKSFSDSLLNEYIDKSIYDSCVSQVKTKLNQLETSYNNKLKQIKDINKQLESGEFKTEKQKRHKYKLINKLCYLNRNKDKNITFGGKTLQRSITKLHSDIKKLKIDLINITDKKQVKIINKQIKDKKELLIKYKKTFIDNRKLGFTFIGRANENGNRKFKFDLKNNKIIFKPNKNTKIVIEFTYRSKQTKEMLYKLQELSDGKSIPLTVTIKGNNIFISYDNELVNGYSFNENECKREQLTTSDKDIKKEIYIKYKREQELTKQKNKINNRYLSVDLNPNYIGLSVFDSKDNNINKIIHKEVIDLTKINVKLGKSSNNKKQLKLNNKRKYEITKVWKYIFNLCKHYKVYNFVMEDLNFKNDNKIKKSNEFNRLTKNLWNRGLIEQLINKYVENIGLNLIKVNPIYSSFIGNMIYSYPDPVSASLEIGRRGIVKYIKGGNIYPELTLINQEKLDYLLGENIVGEWNNWKQLYNIISLLRYRNPIEGLLAKSLESYKSKCLRLIC